MLRNREFECMRTIKLEPGFSERRVSARSPLTENAARVLITRLKILKNVNILSQRKLPDVKRHSSV